MRRAAQKEKYKQRVKEYTHYEIGRKCSENIPKYTTEEISSEQLKIKDPTILRLLTKWCEELWKKFEKKNYFLDRTENIKVQNGGNVNTMFMWMKIPLNVLVENEKKRIEEFKNKLDQSNFQQQAELFQRFLEKDSFRHIEKTEKTCGKFAVKVVSNLHNYIIQYLNRIIHGLLVVSKELYEQKLSTKARWNSPPNLITFKVSDLMRCKISSKEREILHIYSELQALSNKQAQNGPEDEEGEGSDSKEPESDIKIIRIKNRLRQGTHDILINIRFKNKFLCEIQLGVNSKKSKFLSCSNLFSHYIYELGRSQFGPITELCSIWTSLDPRTKQYEKIADSEKSSKDTLNLTFTKSAISCRQEEKKKRVSAVQSEKEHKGEEVSDSKKEKAVIKLNGHELVKEDVPFVCKECTLSFSHNYYVRSHRKCVFENCEYVICCRCLILNDTDEDIKKDLLLERIYD